MLPNVPPRGTPYPTLSLSPPISAIPPRPLPILSAYSQKFQHIQLPLTRLNLTDKRMRAIHPLRQFALRQPGTLARPQLRRPSALCAEKYEGAFPYLAPKSGATQVTDICASSHLGATGIVTPIQGTSGHELPSEIHMADLSGIRRHVLKDRTSGRY